MGRKSLTVLEQFHNLSQLEPDEIADTLFLAGIHGDPRSSETCPLADWITSKGPEWASVSSSRVAWEDQEETIFPSVNIRKFVNRFDAGFYPLLCEGA